MLAQMYSNGEGVAKNLDEAAKWYRKAAEQNFALAQYNMAPVIPLVMGGEG